MVFVFYKLSIAMNFTNTVSPHAKPIRVYQDTKNSSSFWRLPARIYHPLTGIQFADKFRVGARVKMRVLHNNTRTYINATIARIVTYDTCKQFIGSYNIDDRFKGLPFEKVLILNV
jgi:hypothetical protein